MNTITDPIKFTIVTVSYNAIETIKHTLASVSVQTYPHIEHILIDGQSNDGTLAILHRYQERNTREGKPHEVLLSSEPDKGLYDATNKAFAMASGDYICFLNAGDKLHSPETLEKMSAQLTAYNHEELPALLYGDTDIVDKQGQFLHKRRLSPPNNLRWNDFKEGMLVCHQSFYARRDLCPSYQIQYRFSADYDWCIRIMKRAEMLNLPLLNTHMVLSDYLSEGMTTQNHKASLVEQIGRASCRERVYVLV